MPQGVVVMVRANMPINSRKTGVDSFTRPRTFLRKFLGAGAPPAQGAPAEAHRSGAERSGVGARSQVVGLDLDGVRAGGSSGEPGGEEVVERARRQARAGHLMGEEAVDGLDRHVALAVDPLGSRRRE